MGRGLRAVQRDIRAAREAAETERDRIDEWLTYIVGPLEERALHLSRSLELYHGARLAENPRLTSISLPSVTLKSRRQQPAWEIDEDEFRPWADGRPGLFHEPKPAPAPPVDRNAVKAAFTVPDGEPGEHVRPVDPATGEQVPGIVVVIPGRKFEVEF